MRKISNWWVSGNVSTVERFIVDDSFTCLPTLEKSYKYVKKFNRAIDIGTWIGDSTVDISKKFNSVIGFEANPEIYQCCLKNLEERHITNCEIHNLGVSNSAGSKSFFNGASNFSAWISEKENLLNSTKKITIQTITLDELDLTDIDFIKIDVDSHEGFLIEGAKKFLTKNSPVVLIENKVRIHKERQPENMPNPAEILESLGYTMIEKVAKADFIYIKK